MAGIFADAVAIRSALSGSGNTKQQNPECRAKNKGEPPNSERAGADALQFGIASLLSCQALDVHSGIPSCPENVRSVDSQIRLVSLEEAQGAVNRLLDDRILSVFRQSGDFCPGVEWG